MKRELATGFSVFFALLYAIQAIGAAEANKKIILVAHRGGVVDKDHSEDSLKAMEEAIRRGYTHVEVHARCTKDGKVVCFHENNMKAEAGMDARVSDLTLDEVRKNRANPQQGTHQQ